MNKDYVDVRVADLRLLLVEMVKGLHDLRESDLEAIRILAEEARSKFAGFPQEYATKAEADDARKAVSELQANVVMREVYDTNHKRLEDLIVKLDKDKLSEGTFHAFVEDYRRDQLRADEERRAVATSLATSTATVAGALQAGEQREAGGAATYRRIATVTTFAIGAVGGIVTLILLVTHNL